MIPGGVCGKMLSCILFSGIFDSCRVDIIRKPKGFIVFSFMLLFYCYGTEFRVKQVHSFAIGLINL